MLTISPGTADVPPHHHYQSQSSWYHNPTTTTASAALTISNNGGKGVADKPEGSSKRQLVSGEGQASNPFPSRAAGQEQQEEDEDKDFIGPFLSSEDVTVD